MQTATDLLKDVISYLDEGQPRRAEQCLSYADINNLNPHSHDYLVWLRIMFVCGFHRRDYIATTGFLARRKRLQAVLKYSFTEQENLLFQIQLDLKYHQYSSGFKNLKQFFSMPELTHELELRANLLLAHTMFSLKFYHIALNEFNKIHPYFQQQSSHDAILCHSGKVRTLIAMGQIPQARLEIQNSQLCGTNLSSIKAYQLQIKAELSAASNNFEQAHQQAIQASCAFTACGLLHEAQECKYLSAMTGMPEPISNVKTLFNLDIKNGLEYLNYRTVDSLVNFFSNKNSIEYSIKASTLLADLRTRFPRPYEVSSTCAIRNSRSEVLRTSKQLKTKKQQFEYAQTKFHLTANQAVNRIKNQLTSLNLLMTYKLADDRIRSLALAESISQQISYLCTLITYHNRGFSEDNSIAPIKPNLFDFTAFVKPLADALQVKIDTQVIQFTNRVNLNSEFLEALLFSIFFLMVECADKHSTIKIRCLHKNDNPFIVLKFTLCSSIQLNILFSTTHWIVDSLDILKKHQSNLIASSSDSKDQTVEIHLKKFNDSTLKILK